MIRWSFGFLIFAIIAAIFGYGRFTDGAEIARITFYIFTILFVLTFIGSLIFARRRK